MSRLLAVDLGLRLGWALYVDGKLDSYGSAHFRSMANLRSAVWGMLTDAGPPDVVVAEGDRRIGEIWRKAAEKRGAEFVLTSAEEWREALLYERERRGSTVAKESAIERAVEQIEEDDAPRPTGPLNDNAAEAILVGLWATEQQGLRGA